MERSENMKPNTRKIGAEKSREALLEAASMLFDQYGMNCVTVNDICQRAGLTKGAFYHHFEGKEEVASQVFTPQLDRYLEEHYRVCEGASGRERILELARCTYRFSQMIGREATRESYVLLLHRQVSTLYVLTRIHNRILRSGLERAREEGRLRPSVSEDEAVMLFASLMGGFLVKWSTYDAACGPAIDWDKLLEEQFKLLFD